MKILVVDDELLVRVGLKAVFIKYGNKYEIIEAVDGKDALEKYNKHKPSLVFVDITMPKMSGIDFIKEVKKINNNTKFVILTCHNDYHYLRDAIKIGVYDYILKTSIDNKELIRIAEDIEIKTKDIVISQKDNGSIINNNFVNAINNPNYNEYLLDELFMFNNIDKDIFNVFVVAVKNISKIANNKYLALASGIKDIASDLIKEYGYGYVTEIERNKYIILYSCASYNNLQDESSNIKEYCCRLIETVKSYFNKCITIGIYMGAQKSNISEAVICATKALRHSFYDKCGGYQFYNNKQNIKDIPIEINLVKQKLVSRLKTLEYNQFLQVLDNVRYEIIKSQIENIDILINMFLEIYYQIKQHIHEYYPDLKHEIIDSNVDYVFLILSGDIYTIVDIFKQIINKINTNISNNRDLYYLKIIKKTKEYISEHIVEEIDLTTVAQNIFLSPTYFSKIFKEWVGISFIEYCIQERLKKAKSFIKSGDKIYIAASKVGYKNYSYFHKLFKKRTGITPGEYKKRSD